MANNNSTSIEAKIARMQANHENLVQIINKLDATLTKITEVSTDVAQMLAVHESRLEQQERSTKALSVETKHDFEKVDNEIAKLHEKINVVKDDIHKDLDEGFEKIMGKFQELKTDNEDHRTKMDNRYGKLEKIIYVATGGGIVIGFILTKFLPVIWHYVMPHTH
jgi:chromosome segregation ATPase